MAAMTQLFGVTYLRIPPQWGAFEAAAQVNLVSHQVYTLRLSADTRLSHRTRNQTVHHCTAEWRHQNLSTAQRAHVKF